ncbi:hypothetical protein C7974DRAFT_428823 [Boeremia exigua]|uniref:uncharacterized protein n=1 Tax=Boeremia exigua TaxID=749465 RepID=UPI001E8E128B|nr:uncharacterized protein C7974DRAFT_428823 [Boeremia exigua]KAH6613129.1 hypothetical protein C7974DRAFT_428823 [Boeremia exigua]
MFETSRSRTLGRNLIEADDEHVQDRLDLEGGARPIKNPKNAKFHVIPRVERVTFQATRLRRTPTPTPPPPPAPLPLPRPYRRTPVDAPRIFNLLLASAKSLFPSLSHPLRVSHTRIKPIILANFTRPLAALAFPAPHAASTSVSPVPCSLAFKYDDAARQATVLLVATVASIASHSSRDTHTFVLQYDADRLLPGAASLQSGSTVLSQFDGVLRAKDDRRPQVKTLAFSLERPCLVWCPGGLFFAHKPGSEISFQHLTELASATQIHIVFDYKYLLREQLSAFRAFAKAAQDLSGYPSPAQSVPHSPTPSHASDKTVPLSPAAAEALRATLPREPLFDYQTEAINAAVNRHLPAHLERVLPTLLPDLLQALLTRAPASLPGSPHTSFTSSITSPSRPPPLTPLAQALLHHLRTHLQDQFQTYQTHQLRQFQNMLDCLWDSAEAARAHEAAELIDDLEDHKTELLLLRNDTINELSREIDAVFEKSREEGWELNDKLEEQYAAALGDVCDKIERLKRVRVKKMVACEVRNSVWRKKGVRRGVKKEPGRSGKRLLGRKREAEEEVWVDC